MKTIRVGFEDKTPTPLKWVEVNGKRRDPKKPGDYGDVVKYFIGEGYTFDTSDRKDGELITSFIMAETKLDELEILLKKHDWTYMMSDDSRVWECGEAEKRKINALVAELGDEGYKLYVKYQEKAWGKS